MVNTTFNQTWIEIDGGDRCASRRRRRRLLRMQHPTTIQHPKKTEKTTPIHKHHGAFDLRKKESKGWRGEWTPPVGFSRPILMRSLLFFSEFYFPTPSSDSAFSRALGFLLKLVRSGPMPSSSQCSLARFSRRTRCCCTTIYVVRDVSFYFFLYYIFLQTR